jgi:hypothetical protein
VARDETTGSAREVPAMALCSSKPVIAGIRMSSTMHGRLGRRLCRQEACGVGERLDLEPRRPDQALQGLADRWVVVDEKDGPASHPLLSGISSHLSARLVLDQRPMRYHSARLAATKASACIRDA